jgi:exoribonuclease R
VKLDFSLGKDGMPVLVAPKASTSSMQMIEELMLLANFIVARKLLLDGEDQPTRVLRHHADPVPGALQQLTGQLKLSGMDLNIWTAGSIHQSIQNIEMQHGSEVAKIVQVLIMGPMRPATYVVAQGKQSAESLRHYALNMACYSELYSSSSSAIWSLAGMMLCPSLTLTPVLPSAHFTSPIRRYADVMVHRALLRILDGPQQQPPSESSVHLEEMELAQALCERINARRLLAKEAEDRSRLVHYCAYLMSLPASSPVHLTAAVISTGSRSFTVHVMSLGLSARLHVDEMEMEGLISVWNKESSRLILTRSEDDANGDWSTLKLELCTQVVVRPTVRASASPIELKFELVGLAEHSTASKPQ